MNENSPQNSCTARPAAGGDVLALGFGITVAMWAIGYLGRMPGILLPSPVIGGLMLACPLIGGFIAGRGTHRGWRGGTISGFISALLNLLILGSMLKGDETHPAPNVFIFLPATLAITTLITTLAAGFGSISRNPKPAIRNPNWSFRFALVALLATALLLLAGGLVTGREAGLAVPDWPNSYGSNMFLYPLARMTGNIYYEHTHRLVGSLVGLTTVVLALHLMLGDRRRWLKVLAFAAVLLVCAQGYMGGQRVGLAKGAGDKRQGVEVATQKNESDASTILRVAHGITGQLFFALMAGLAVFTSTAWKNGPQTLFAGASTDRFFTLLLLGLLLIQLLLGALLRHLDAAMMMHVTFASLVFLAALAAGMRLLGLHGKTHPPLRRLALALLGIVVIQVILGIVALIFRAGSADAPEPTLADVLTTTAHQLNGAALLAVATAAMLFTHRLLKPAGAEPL